MPEAKECNIRLFRKMEEISQLKAPFAKPLEPLGNRGFNHPSSFTWRFTHFDNKSPFTLFEKGGLIMKIFYLE